MDKTGLSGGWRGFSIAHKLLEGDALVFQLIKPCKFKVILHILVMFQFVRGSEYKWILLHSVANKHKVDNNGWSMARCSTI